MPIGGCEMVLGIKWLSTLGSVAWNFAKMTMNFEVGGQKHCLQGLTDTTVQMIDSDGMLKLLTHAPTAYWAQIRVSSQENQAPLTTVPESLAPLIKEFQFLF